MALDDFNGTRSIIIDQINQVLRTPPTANSVLMIGTAKRGANNQLVKPEDGDVEEIYGDVSNDPSFDTNLVRHYYEITRSTANGTDVFMMRVGDAKKATLNLYESQGLGGTGYGGTGTGDFSPTVDPVNDALTFSLLNEALVEGAEANEGRVEIVEDGDTGVPKAITFETPDGARKTFGLDPYGKSPNALSNVRDIARAINADPDWSRWYVTKYPVLRKSELAVSAQKDSRNGIYIEIDGGGESFGDKLESLEEVAIRDPAAEDDIPYGVTTFTLSNIPEKDDSEVTTTVDEFQRLVEDETVITVDAAIVGQSLFSATPFLGKSNSRWDSDIAFVYDDDPVSDYYANANLVIVKPNANRITVPKKNSLDETIWSLDASGQLTGDLSKFSTQTQMQLGDRFVMTYRYKAFFKEANVRSAIETGNEFSYFIKGDEIIFGAATTLPVRAVYSTKKIFEPSDLDVTDANNIIVYFVNPLTRPAEGAEVLVTYTYLPELPATSSAILTTPSGKSVVQRSGFSGGDDGRRVGKLRYKQLVADALDLVELYPFKQIFVAGAFLDDTVEGYDDETGLPATVAVDWGTMLVPKIARRSWLVKECTMNLPVRPPNGYTPKEVNAWFDRLINGNATEAGRPANMIDALRGPDSFRFNVVAGAPIGAVGAVLGGSQYVMNPAAVYTGMKQDLPIEYSHTNQLLPPNVLDLGVKILNAEIIGNMNSKKYTFFTVDAAGNRLVADAPSAAQVGSSFDRQFVVDAIYAAIDVVRTTAERFIGLPRSPDNLLAMRNKCQRNVQYLVPKVFQNIQIEVLDVPDGSITGRTKLGLTAITSREIRRVDVETRITLV